ncbi:MAG: S9 family peptidase [Candidatus Dormibacteraeota bacterium]|nr:S9 family peptidase [Candidatus Dormibacteraeota bacterium]
MAQSRLRVTELQFDGGVPFWIEGRPAEKGRCVVVRHVDGANHDMLPEPFSARTRVHEYGGGALHVAGGTVYFSNAPDRRLYAMESDAAPRPLTPDLGDVRYADMRLDSTRDRLVVVCEDHRGSRVVNDIRVLPRDGGEPETIVSGNDFYSNPRVSPDGTRMAWLTWNQPNMPWDGTELWTAELGADGRPRDARRVAGGPREAVFQPEWSPDSVLHFITDPTGWWNLYRWDGDEAHPLCPMEAECGQPAWAFGLSSYAFLDDGRIALSACRDGLWRVGLLSPDGGGFDDLGLAITDVDGCVVSDGVRIGLLAGGEREPLSAVVVQPGDRSHTVLRRSTDLDIDDALISAAIPVSFPGWEGATAHAFFYAPRSDTCEAGPEETPPLLVRAHGGPTSATTPAMDPLVQYWTSRGFAFLDVNYGGSTGYGRAYRERLNLQEGVVDVGDCVAGALHMAETGRADGARLLIEGGSAGGYIVLCAMTFHDAFAAGSSLFGIADIETLVAETHKFEAQYFETMVGPYPLRRHVYHDRSPIHFIERVRRPVILFQGLDDPIVPRNQAETMFASLCEAGIPTAYIGYPGEEHGFRQAANIARTVDAERYFFSRVLGIEVGGDVEPVDIVNLERRQTA